MAKEKSPRAIDRIREGAGMITVGSDGDPATQLLVIGKKLHVLKANSMHLIMLADDFDPNRQNPNVPNAEQKILNYGTSNDVVCRTLLTADALFPENRPAPVVNRADILRVSKEIMENILRADEIRRDLLADIEIAESKEGPISRAGFQLPSLPGLYVRMKEFIQKAEHAAQGMRDLYYLFYANEIAAAPGKDFDGISNAIEAKYGSDDRFSGFTSEIADIYKSLRNIRHCVEHRSLIQEMIIEDFKLSARAEIVAPTIRVVHRVSAFDAMPLSDFLSRVVSSLTEGAETIIVYLAMKNIPPIIGWNIQIAFIPPEQRSGNSKVQFGYFHISDDGALPLL